MNYCSVVDRPRTQNSKQPLSLAIRQVHMLNIKHINIPSGPYNYRISFNRVFCAIVKLAGNLTLTSTSKSPLSAGFLLFGIPRFGKGMTWPGCVGPPPDTGTCLPSIVPIVRLQPVNDSLRSSSTVARRLSSSRLNRGCGFCSSSQHGRGLSLRI